MTDTIAITILAGTAIILLIATARQQRQNRKQLANETKNQPSIKRPAPRKPKHPFPPKVVTVQNIPALVEALAVKASVQQMVASQEAPASRPRNNRRRGRPGKKQENNSTK